MAKFLSKKIEFTGWEFDMAGVKVAECKYPDGDMLLSVQIPDGKGGTDYLTMSPAKWEKIVKQQTVIVKALEKYSGSKAERALQRVNKAKESANSMVKAGLSFVAVKAALIAEKYSDAEIELAMKG